MLKIASSEFSAGVVTIYFRDSKSGELRTIQVMSPSDGSSAKIMVRGGFFFDEDYTSIGDSVKVGWVK